MARQEAGSLDVTRGVIWRHLVALAIPILVQNLFQQAYFLADTYVVGQFAGVDALGGIQAATALCDLVLQLGFGICAGCAVIVGQLFGAHDDERLARSVHVAAAIALVLGVIATIVGLAGIGPLLQVMGTPEELMGQALAYSRLYFATMVFWFAENMCAAILRAVGDARTPSAIIAFACCLNVVLDFAIVGGLGLEAFGAQLATSISVATSAILMISRLVRARGAWRLDWRGIHLEWPIARKMLVCGIPLGLQMGAFPLSNTLVQSAINSFGPTAVAAWGLAGRLTAVLWLFIDAIAVALTAFAAQNYGAGELDRMRRGLRISLAWMVAGAGSIAAILVVLARALSFAFVDDDSVATLLEPMIAYIAPFFVFYGVGEVISGYIRGTGESVGPMAITLLGTCLLRIIWVLVAMPMNPPLSLILLSYPVSYMVTAAAFVVLVRIRRPARPRGACGEGFRAA